MPSYSEASRIASPLIQVEITGRARHIFQPRMIEEGALHQEGPPVPGMPEAIQESFEAVSGQDRLEVGAFAVRKGKQSLAQGSLQAIAFDWFQASASRYGLITACTRQLSA